MNKDTAKIVAKQLLTQPKTYILFVVYFLLYELLATLIQGFSLFSSFYTTMIPLLKKIQVTPYLFESAFLGNSHLTTTLQTLIALLFAANLTLITGRVHVLKNESLKISTGAGIIALAVAGCSACGISLLALLGLSSALIALPFHGKEILVLTIGILTITLVYNFRALTQSCKIN